MDALHVEVEWEQAPREPFDLFWESMPGTGWDLDPNALLLACYLPAWGAGERRVVVDEGTLCPALLLRLRTVVSVLQRWYPELGAPPEVVAAASRVRLPADGAGLTFLSCGVDSLATLRWTTSHLPPGHPASVRRAVSLRFQEQPSSGREEFDDRTAGMRQWALPVTQPLGVELVPVVTNLWWLTRGDGWFYDQKWHGSLLASVAHLLSSRSSVAYAASSWTTHDLHPWGSHPSLDENCSSAHLRVEHRGNDWGPNCGTCEKCLRTMLALVALDALQNCRAFAQDDLAPEHVATLGDGGMLTDVHLRTTYAELPTALQAAGRADLADAVTDVLSQTWPERA